MAELGLQSTVTLVGHRDDVEWIYGGVDLALITSMSEGVPGVAIEAQMTGCPVVSFPVGSVASVIDHLETGIPLLLARSIGRVVWSGPLIVPGRSPCWACLAHRLEAHRQAHGYLRERGVECSDVDDQPWGRFVRFDDPDGNRWALQQIVRPT